ncbi:MAG: DUF6351 family protein [Gammaproteobacteria bacterium]|nr:DUF6351 family protein [Gammaproteobacteria bacterium]
MKTYLKIFSLILIFILSSCKDDNNKPNTDFPVAGNFEVEVLSSPPDQVSGGDARIKIYVPDGLALDQVDVYTGGIVITSMFNQNTTEHTLEGLVTGLALGQNKIMVSAKEGQIRSFVLILTNHSLTGPIFSGPQQPAFYCRTDELNLLGLGTPDENCMVEPLTTFVYRTTGNSWAEYTPGMARPADMATTTTSDGNTVDFIVRWERGTINRFIYSIAILSAASQDLAQPDLNTWNNRLLYYFQGGVAIGHTQGTYSTQRLLYVDGLSKGYAIAYSTGTKTGTHYNLQVGGETAIMVKDRFVSAYDAPEYTVSVGGSGGGIQQYIYAQNHPGLIDAAVPQYSYPDMITQTIHIGDCELIERWVDMKLLADPASHWQDWTHRSFLIGLNASNAISNPVITNGLTPWIANGSSECTKSWRGLSALVMNPHFGTVWGITPEDQVGTDWTHYDDAINIYGYADDGYARSTWDNVGVQYGLQALKDGNITPAEFLDLNFNAGSWKNEPDMIQEGCPLISALCGLIDVTQNLYPDQIDPWSARNMNLSDGVNPAPRREADDGAIEAAYAGGLVNTGSPDIPMIDLRHYLEGVLDMHNSHQSFAVRQRLLDYDGDASNQLIWFVDPGAPLHDPTPYALDVLDRWMANIKANPEMSIAANRPDDARDSCFDGAGTLVASGDDVWDGIIDSNVDGACTQRYTIYSTSRIIAGGPISGEIFKCELQSVDDAITSGVYGTWQPLPEDIVMLKAIFPTGVCMY